jgi:hypothetical protein
MGGMSSWADEDGSINVGVTMGGVSMLQKSRSRVRPTVCGMSDYSPHESTLCRREWTPPSLR